MGDEHQFVGPYILERTLGKGQTGNFKWMMICSNQSQLNIYSFSIQSMTCRRLAIINTYFVSSNQAILQIDWLCLSFIFFISTYYHLAR